VGADVGGQLTEEAGQERKGALTSMLAGLATVFVVNFLVRGLVEGIFARNATEWPYNPAVIRLAGMITARLLEVLAVLVALAILFRLTRHGSFADLGLRRQGAGWLPVGFAVPMLALALATWVASILGLLPGERLLFPGPWPTALAFAAATQAAWIEEIGFRGFLMQGIERLAGGGPRARSVAIVVSGLLFAALHILAPFELTWAWWIVVTAAGLGFGWAFYAAGRNLWLPIGLHWGFDLGLFLLLGLPGESRGWIDSPVLGATPALSQVGGYVMLLGTFLTMLTLLLLTRWRNRELV
jgi:membrane protease YdiL (CAAX protease family)